jgi:hypothetical protein
LVTEGFDSAIDREEVVGKQGQQQGKMIFEAPAWQIGIFAQDCFYRMTLEANTKGLIF